MSREELDNSCNAVQEQLQKGSEEPMDLNGRKHGKDRNAAKPATEKSQVEKKKMNGKKMTRFENKHKDLAEYIRARNEARMLPRLSDENDWLFSVIDMHRDVADNVALDEEMKKEFSRWNTPRGVVKMKDARGKWCFSSAPPPITSWGDARAHALIVLDVARQW